MPKKKTKKKINIMTKKWTSLTKLRDHFDREGGETVVSFNGFELVTKRYRYTLALSELHREKK